MIKLIKHGIALLLTVLVSVEAAAQTGGASMAQPLLDQMNRRADRLDEELRQSAIARANQRQQRRMEEAMEGADVESPEGRAALYARLTEYGFGNEVPEIRRQLEAEARAKEDRARQQERADLENELLRLQIEAIANGGNTAVTSPSAAEPADLASIVQALTDSSSDAVITDAELSAIAGRASSISSDFGQAFTVTRSFIAQSAAADTAPDVFANTQSQMRSVYSSLDRDQTLVMIDFVLREAVTATRMSNEVGSSSSTDRGQDLIAGLSSLNDLHERGLLNEEEFNAAKRRLLGL